MSNSRDIVLSDYRYEELETSEAEIRLLTLLPGTEGSPISCTIEHVSLKAPPPYHALSYMWGDSALKSSIVVGGHKLEIRTGLLNILRQLRDEQSELVIWIDALCINQGDPVERANQVKMMREIFKNATQIFAWIGDVTNSSQTGLALMKELAEVFDTVMEEYAGMFEEQYIIRAGYEESKDWTPLFELMTRPYWTRLWILQELAVPDRFPFDYSEPDNVILCCGSERTPMSTFYKACDLIRYLIEVTSLSARLAGSGVVLGANSAENPEATLPGFEMATLVRLVSWGYGLERPPDAMRLLCLSRNLHATDPRDKLYGLLGMACKDDLTFQPDYTIDIQQMWVNLGQHVIRKDQDLGFLSGSRPQWEGCVPSWAPDIRSGYPTSEPPEWTHRLSTWKVSMSSLPRVHFTNDSKLSVKGFEFDRIEKTVGPFRWYSGGHDPRIVRPDSVIPLIRQFREEFLTPEQRSILWRVLLLDFYVENEDQITKPAPERARQMFDMMINPPEDLEQNAETIDRIAGLLSNFLRCLMLSLTDRVIFTTKSGRMGVGPYEARGGDIICIFYGGKACYIVRPIVDEQIASDSAPCYAFQGDAYVYGVMDGELMAKEGEETVHPLAAEEKDFLLR